ncbi:hypothetical protein L0222_30625 [bacterium]|nr:hypothetical protein [bacterium]MCI0602195.1 hypothetical protein [bacterium]
MKHTNPDLGSEEKPPLILSSSRYFFWKPVLFIHQNGFRIRIGSNDSSIFFSDARILKWKEADSYTNGICTGTKYEIILATSSGKISLKHISKIDPPDDFPFFANKLIGQLADRAQNEIESGGSLQGNGWILTAEALQSNGKKLNCKEIWDAAMSENHVTVWKLQESYPFVRIPMETAQSRILLEILDRYVKKNPPPQSSSSLGRLLFRRKDDSALQLFLSILLQRRTWDFYENGIIQRPGHRVLFFRNCETLQYAVGLQFVNGIYAFTRTQLKLKSLPDLKLMQIKTQRYGNDKELEQAKLDISKQIADRLYLKVATQQDVPWGRFARISKDEVRYLSTSLLGGNFSMTFPFSKPLSYSFDSGKFYLFNAVDAQPLFTMDCDEENFYPGFFLLLRLVGEYGN